MPWPWWRCLPRGSSPPRARARRSRRPRPPARARPGPPAGARGGRRNLERDLPQREPAGDVLLEGQLGADLGLEPQLALGVAGVVARRRDERVVAAALEVVDEVDGLPLVLEREDRGEQAVAVAALLELRRDRVEGDDEVLEVWVAEDQPAVAVLVGRGLDGGAGVLGAGAQQVLGLLDDPVEVRGLERLEDDPCRGLVLEAEPGVERDLRRGHREQAVGRRALDPLPATAEQR